MPPDATHSTRAGCSLQERQHQSGQQKRADDLTGNGSLDALGRLRVLALERLPALWINTSTAS